MKSISAVEDEKYILKHLNLLILIERGDDMENTNATNKWGLF